MRKYKKTTMTAATFLTAGLFALSMLGGCGKTGQEKADPVDKFQESQESQESQEADTSKRLTMEDKERILSLEELQNYSEQYYVSCNMLDYEEGEILIDGYGNVDVGKNVGNLYVKKLVDICTEEVLYYKECYVTKNEEKKSDYYETVGVPHTRLYDAKGNLLIDWQDVDYGDAFGDWIIKATYSIDSTFETPLGQRVLYNVKDGSTMDKVSDFASMDSDKARLMDDAYNVVAVLDHEGNILFKDLLQDTQDKNVSLFMKNGYYYTSCWDENAQKCVCTFYDKDEKQVFSFEYDDYVDFYQPNTVGPYIIHDGTQGDRVLDLRGDGQGGVKEVYKAGDITYYDGDRIIADHNGDEQYGLFDADGNQIASFKGKIVPENVTADKLYFEQSNDLEKAETFLAVDGDIIKRIDRDGKELAAYQLPSSDVKIMDIEIYDEGIYFNGDDFEHAGLLSKDLKETVPFKAYSNSYCTIDEVTGIRYLYVTEQVGSVLKDSLYTLDGKLILSNMKKITTIRNGKVAVLQGKYFGIMDLNGQWIYKYSLMDYMGDWI